jgi:hypothetical protein
VQTQNHLQCNVTFRADKSANKSKSLACQRQPARIALPSTWQGSDDRHLRSRLRHDLTILGAILLLLLLELLPLETVPQPLELVLQDHCVADGGAYDDLRRAVALAPLLLPAAPT